LIKTLDFEKNANFFSENKQKSQKLVMITSTPGMVAKFFYYKNKCFDQRRNAFLQFFEICIRLDLLLVDKSTKKNFDLNDTIFCVHIFSQTFLPQKKVLQYFGALHTTRASWRYSVGGEPILETENR
jgi:hypothetical protein